MFTNGAAGVYIFDLYNGFKATYTIADSTGGDSFVAPRGTVHAGDANACA